METEAIPVKKPRFRWLTPEIRLTIRLFLILTMVGSIFERWSKTQDRLEDVSPISNLNLDYASEIDVKTALMTRAQLGQLFQNLPDESIAHWEPEQSKIVNDPTKMFIVISLRNRGDKYVWGRIRIDSERWGWGSGVGQREIPFYLLSPKMDKFQITILSLDWQADNFKYRYRPLWLDRSDAITTEWVSLYTSKEAPHE